MGSPLLARWAGPALLGILGAVMAFASWGTWPDVQVDFGRELYVPWQLGEGRVLYRDIAWFNGPLSPYWNAWMFGLFGVGLRTLVWTNLALLAVLTGLAYGLVARVADRSTATLAGAVLLAVFAFNRLAGIGNYNFVTPYSHEATHGLLLALAALACFARFESRGGRGWAAGCGLCLGLALLTKPEISAALLAALAAAWLWLPAARRAGATVPFAAAAALPPLAAFLLLCLALPPGAAATGLLAGWRGVLRGDAPELFFYRHMAGFDRPGARIAAIAWTTAGALALFGPAVLLERVLPRRGVWRAAAAAIVFAAATAALVALAVDWLRVLRVLPVALAALLGVELWRRFGHSRSEPPAATRAGLVVLSLALLAKLLLSVWALQYGFALALPGTLVLVAALWCWTPSALARAGSGGAVFRAAALAVALLFSAAHVLEARRWIAVSAFEIGAGADRFRADARAELAGAALDALQRRFGPDATLAVLPEGVMLNYLARRRNPTPYVNFMPPELVLFGEERVLEAFEANAPDALVLWHKDTSEYGVPLFGRDYGTALMDWVRRHYRPVETVGAAPLRDPRVNGLQLLERLDGGAATPP